MKSFIFICLTLPSTAFAQFYTGFDVTAGKPKLKIDIPPDIQVTHQTSSAAFLRLYNGYQWNNNISLEMGLAIRTPFIQSAIYLPLPDTGYRIIAYTTNIDLALSYRLPEIISNRFKLLLGAVWTRTRFHVNKYVLGEDMNYAVSDVHIKPVYGIQYNTPLSPTYTWKTTLTRYGDDTILSFGISHSFN